MDPGKDILSPAYTCMGQGHQAHLCHVCVFVRSRLGHPWPAQQCPGCFLFSAGDDPCGRSGASGRQRPCHGHRSAAVKRGACGQLQRHHRAAPGVDRGCGPASWERPTGQCLWGLAGACEPHLWGGASGLEAGPEAKEWEGARDGGFWGAALSEGLQGHGLGGGARGLAGCWGRGLERGTRSGALQSKAAGGDLADQRRVEGVQESRPQTLPRSSSG